MHMQADLCVGVAYDLSARCLLRPEGWVNPLEAKFQGVVNYLTEGLLISEPSLQSPHVGYFKN